jgi:hypothetical protein
VIRKILFFTSLVFTIFWFSVAYVLKSKTSSLIKNSESDNIKISYHTIQVSGFPYLWQIKIISPVITFIDHRNSRELSAKEVTCLFDLSFKKATINFGHSIKQVRNVANRIKIHQIASDDSIGSTIKLTKALFMMSKGDNLYKNVKSLEFSIPLLSINNDNHKICDLNNLLLTMHKSPNEDNESVVVKFQAFYDKSVLDKDRVEEAAIDQAEFPQSYNNIYSFFNVNKADIDLVASVNFLHSKDNIDEKILKDLTLDHINLKFEDSEINIAGSMWFAKNQSPAGKVFVAINNYNEAINRLMVDNYFISKSKLKKIILQMAASSTSESDLDILSSFNNIRFDVEFSDYGIKLGKINLLQ